MIKNLLVTFLFFVFITTGCGNDSGNGQASGEDYIEITSIEPGVVTEGEEVILTIHFDFHLSSDDVGNIWVGFNDDFENPDIYTVEHVISIVEPFEGSESITISTRPRFYEPPHSYNVYLNLSPNTFSKWVPLAVDTWPIAVNQGVSANNEERSGYCADCNFVECRVFLCPN